MPALVQPVEEARLGFAQIGAGDAQGVEAERPAPLLDAPGESRPVPRGFRVIHANHDSAATPQLHLRDEAATLALGAALARALSPGLVIYLEGDLGAGKTTLVRGMLRALGFAGHVKSPSFTLVELYAISRLDLYHFDFYRFANPEEYLDAGLDEYFHGDSICLVEWPDKARGYVPPADLRLCLRHAAAGRDVRIEAASQRGAACLNVLSREAGGTALPGPWDGAIS